jgi:hypothetical protein
LSWTDPIDKQYHAKNLNRSLRLSLKPAIVLRKSEFASGDHLQRDSDFAILISDSAVGVRNIERAPRLLSRA